MAVFPESMNRLNPDDTAGSLNTLESYVNYITERVEFAMRNMTRNVSEAGTSSVEVLLLLQEMAGTVSQLASQVNAMNGQINTIGSELSTVKQKVTGIESQITTLNGQVSGLQGNVNTMSGQIAALDARVSALENPGTEVS